MHSLINGRLSAWIHAQAKFAYAPGWHRGYNLSYQRTVLKQQCHQLIFVSIHLLFKSSQGLRRHPGYTWTPGCLRCRPAGMSDPQCETVLSNGLSLVCEEDMTNNNCGSRNN